MLSGAMARLAANEAVLADGTRVAGKAMILKPAVGCELRVGFAALDNHGERLRPVRGAVAGRVGDPSGNVAVLR
jgi:hypothetical protein